MLKIGDRVMVAPEGYVHPAVRKIYGGVVGEIVGHDEMRDWVVEFPGLTPGAFDTSQLDPAES